jgi:hypothetical protein
MRLKQIVPTAEMAHAMAAIFSCPDVTVDHWPKCGRQREEQGAGKKDDDRRERISHTIHHEQPQSKHTPETALSTDRSFIS